MAEDKDLTPEEQKAFEEFLEKHDNKKKDRYELIVHNDETHSFDEIILNLMKACKHEEIQATQCTHLIHYKGSCQVKIGSKKDLNEIKGWLEAEEIIVTLEEYSI